MRAAPVAATLLVALHVLAACDETPPGATPRFEVEDAGLDLGLSLPAFDGWELDETIELADADAGGEALVLYRQKAPVGSPKITVSIAPAAEKPTRLGPFLEENLRAMGKLEREAGMQITRVAQKPLALGPRRAYVVRHEFTIGKGDTQQALTQLAAILVVDGRGVTVTAVGRTELFHPLAEQISRILTGIEIAAPTAQRDAPEPEAEAEPPPQPAEAVDLGTLGGK